MLADDSLDLMRGMNSTDEKRGKMKVTTAQETIENAKRTIDEMSSMPTDGKWLESITVEVSPHIKEWDIDLCYRWSEWTEREFHFPGTTNQGRRNRCSRDSPQRR